MHLSGKLRRALVGGCEINVHATAFLVETDASVNEGEDGVVTTNADACTWNPFGSTLTDDDVSSDDGFSAKAFDSETLAAAVASIFDATLSFFMGHEM